MARARDREVAALADEYMAGTMSRRTLIQRLLALGLTSSAVGGIVSACGSGSSSDTTAAGATVPKTVDATVHFLLGPYTDQEKQNQQHIARAFNALYPNVKFKFDLFEWGTNTSEVQTSAVDGLHDVYLLTEADYVLFGDREDLFEDLGPRVNDPGFASEKAKYLYWDRTKADSKRLIGMPINWHIEQGLFTNMDLIKSVGYGPEYADSWDTFADCLRKVVKAHPGVRGIDMLATDIGGWYGRVRSAGADFLTPDLSAPAINTPEVVAATQQLVDLFRVDKTAAPPGTFTYDTAEAAFLSGKLAVTSMDFTRTAVWNTPKKKPSFEWDVFPWPPGSKGRLTFNDSNYWAMSAHAKNKDLIWEVLKFWTSADQLGFWTTVSGTYAMRSDTQAAMKRNHAAPQAINAFKTFVDASVGPQPFKEWGTVEKQARAQVVRAYSGQISAEKAVQNAEQIVKNQVQI